MGVGVGGLFPIGLHTLMISIHLPRLKVFLITLTPSSLQHSYSLSVITELKAVYYHASHPKILHFSAH